MNSIILFFMWFFIIAMVNCGVAYGIFRWLDELWKRNFYVKWFMFKDHFGKDSYFPYYSFNLKLVCFFWEAPFIKGSQPYDIGIRREK